MIGSRRMFRGAGHALRALVARSVPRPRRMLASISAWDGFLRDIRQINQQLGSDEDFEITRWYPILNEREQASGVGSGHYFHQDLLVAQRIFENAPERHVDIGSRIDGFVAHVASFREIEVLDIRPQTSSVKNIRFVQADLMKPSVGLAGYTDSLSSLNVVEHFGLGRYGDAIDAYGHVKGIENMHRILRPGGRFYFSVPIGRQRIEFNAHRVFGLRYLLHLLSDRFTVEQFSYVDDGGLLYENVPLADRDVAENFGCEFGCAIFELRKR